MNRRDGIKSALRSGGMVELIRIILATLVSTTPSFLAYGLILWLQRRREADPLYSIIQEKQRARRIKGTCGPFLIYAVKLGAIVCAVGPCLLLALAILNPAVNAPTSQAALQWVALYLGGWMVFGWCDRIIHALDRRHSA